MPSRTLRLVSPSVAEHRLWALTKAGHQVQARVRTSSLGLELRILLDGDLWWSQVVRPATEDALTAVAELKRMEFEAKGWTAA